MAKKHDKVYFSPFLLEIEGSNLVTRQHRPRSYHALIFLNSAIITMGKMAKNDNNANHSQFLLYIEGGNFVIMQCRPRVNYDILCGKLVMVGDGQNGHK